MRYVKCAWYTILMLICGAGAIHLASLNYRHWEDMVVIGVMGCCGVLVFASLAVDALNEKTVSESTDLEEIDPDLLELLESIDAHYQTKQQSALLPVLMQGSKYRTALSSLVSKLDDWQKDNLHDSDSASQLPWTKELNDARDLLRSNSGD